MRSVRSASGHRAVIGPRIPRITIITGQAPLQARPSLGPNYLRVPVNAADPNLGRGRKPSTFDAASVFEACARTGTAVEINSRPERRDPPPELLEQAGGAGCLFRIDTDAHPPHQPEWQGYGRGAAAHAA